MGAAAADPPARPAAIWTNRLGCRPKFPSPSLIRLGCRLREIFFLGSRPDRLVRTPKPSSDFIPSAFESHPLAAVESLIAPPSTVVRRQLGVVVVEGFVTPSEASSSSPILRLERRIKLTI